MDADTATMLRQTVRHVLETTSGEAVVVGLADLGWDEVFAVDDRACTEILFEEHGRAHACSPVLDTVVLRSLGFPIAGHRMLYPSGGVDPTCVLDARGGILELSGWLVGGEACTGKVVAVCGGRAEELRAVVVDVASTDVVQRRIVGVDEGLALVRVTGTAEVDDTAVRSVDGMWVEAVAVAHRALGSEIIAAAQMMLDLAIDHARTRVQFGHPIGTFQAVKHHLAEAHVAIVAARLALDEAWDTRDPLTAALGKALAGDAARKAQKESQQILAAIGFTWEHDLHRYMRRAMALDGLLGSAASLRVQMGESFAGGWPMPRVGAL
jgi:alkylation response protein AidB-like acyl-CoA dehydrogenase